MGARLRLRLWLRLRLRLVVPGRRAALCCRMRHGEARRRWHGKSGRRHGHSKARRWSGEAWRRPKTRRRHRKAWERHHAREWRPRGESGAAGRVVLFLRRGLIALGEGGPGRRVGGSEGKAKMHGAVGSGIILFFRPILVSEPQSQAAEPGGRRPAAPLAAPCTICAHPTHDRGGGGA